jgi:hypothetical protein
MSLSTYDALQSALLAWLDVEVGQAGLDADRVSDAIALAEAKIARDLRVRESRAQLTQEIDVDATNSRGWVESPPGFQGLIDAELHIGDRTYWLAEIGVFAKHRGQRIEIAPITEPASVTLYFWQEFTPLARVPDSTNWLLQKHPDAYLYGSRAELFDFLADPRETQEREKFNGVMRQINDNSIGREWLSLPQVSIGGGTP